MEIEDGLYLVNGTRRLYYQDGIWYKAVYSNGRYNGYIEPLKSQPKKINELLKLTYI